MSALSFSTAVAVRPAVAASGLARAAKANKAVDTTPRALGGFGPNMPKEDYLKKMEAKKKLIEANKAKAAAKNGGKKAGFGFGKKAAEPKKAEKKSLFSFGKK